MSYLEVHKFWFSELTPKQWFVKDRDLDILIQQRFGDTHQSAGACELSEWRRTPEGRLAEIIVLDQFSRNIYRDDRRAFFYDSLALALAQEAVRCGDDQKIAIEHRSFFYMPYMHSESKIIHESAVKLFQTPSLEHNLDFELRHKKIIDRFGRYPHRNDILGRHSTSDEIEFLKQPGSGF